MSYNNNNNNNNNPDITAVLHADTLATVAGHVKKCDLLPLALSCKNFLLVCVERNGGGTKWQTKATGSIARMTWAIDACGATPTSSWSKQLARDHDRVGILWLTNERNMAPTSDVITSATIHGHLELVKFLRTQQPPFPWCDDTFAAAALRGDIETLNYLIVNGCPFNARSCDCAAYTGKLEALKHIFEAGCPMHQETWMFAALSGNLAVLEYLRDVGCPRDEYHEHMVCRRAAFEGSINVLEWLRVQSPPFRWDKGVCADAASGGQLATLKWLRAQSPPCPWDEDLLAAASDGGYDEILVWATANGCPDDDA